MRCNTLSFTQQRHLLTNNGPTMNTTIESFISHFDTLEAFRRCASEVQSDPQRRRQFLRLLRLNCDVAQLAPAADDIRAEAEAGNPYMRYAWARYHDALHPQSDSPAIALRHYALAADGGVDDARALLALCYRDGDFGEPDLDRYRDEMQRALDMGSMKAQTLRLIGQIYGSHDTPYDPEAARDTLLQLLGQPQGAEDAQLHCLLGKALGEMGDKEAAVQQFQQAIALGSREAFFHLAYTTCRNDDGEIDTSARERFLDIMRQARDADATDGLLDYALILTPQDYDDLEPAEQQRIHDILLRQLPYAADRGEGIAAYYLGSYYDEGAMGFDADEQEMWRWYGRGADLRQTDCMKALADKLLDPAISTIPPALSLPAHITNNPAAVAIDTPEALAHEYRYRALMLGDEEALDDVIEAYQQGLLPHHEAAIRNIYLPRWEERHRYESDEEESYGDDYDAMLAEREREEDDWGMDPDIDTRISVCWQCVEQAQAAWNDRPWEIADKARRFLAEASSLLQDGTANEELCEWCDKMCEMLSDHPRLRLRLTELATALAADPEQRTELEQTAAWLRSNIARADAGELDKIEQRGFLRKDPVEWTARWEEVIDDADRRAYATLGDIPRGMGFCFEYWSARHSALLRYGIDWRSPHQMNPRVLFD